MPTDPKPETLANGRPVIDTKKLDYVMALVTAEFLKAHAKHPTFPTCHHGHSVIEEEFEELWAEIKADRGNLGPAKKEAAQLACVAIRYIYDLCS